MDIKKLTFAAACKSQKLDPKKVKPDFAYLPIKERKAMAAHAMCVIMVAAANQIANGGKPWKADYTNGEVKYEARWYHKGGSSGFRFYGCDSWSSLSLVGSRLAFKDYDTMRALCDNKVYIKLWNEYAL